MPRVSLGYVNKLLDIFSCKASSKFLETIEKVKQGSTKYILIYSKRAYFSFSAAQFYRYLGTSKVT